MAVKSPQFRSWDSGEETLEAIHTERVAQKNKLGERYVSAVNSINRALKYRGPSRGDVLKLGFATGLSVLLGDIGGVVSGAFDTVSLAKARPDKQRRILKKARGVAQGILLQEYQAQSASIDASYVSRGIAMHNRRESRLASDHRANVARAEATKPSHKVVNAGLSSPGFQVRPAAPPTFWGPNMFSFYDADRQRRYNYPLE